MGGSWEPKPVTKGIKDSRNARIQGMQGFPEDSDLRTCFTKPPGNDSCAIGPYFGLCDFA